MARHPSRDWHALKAEWLQGNETLNQFRERYNLADNWFYKKVREMDWEGAKGKIVAKLESNLISRLAKEWMKPFKISDRIEDHVGEILNQHGDEKKIHTLIEPEFLKDMALTVERTVKTKKLLLGESTGDQSQITQNLYIGIAQLVNQSKQAQKSIDVQSEPVTPMPQSTQVGALPANPEENGQIEEL